MAVTYVGETNASDLDSGQSTAALAIAAPAGSATDDLLIAFVHTNNTKGLTLPAGWTTLLRLNTFSYLDLWVAYRVKQAGDTSWTWTQTTPDLISGKMVAVRGADPGALVTASNAQNAAYGHSLRGVHANSTTGILCPQLLKECHGQNHQTTKKQNVLDSCDRCLADDH